MIAMSNNISYRPAILIIALYVATFITMYMMI